MRSRPGKSQIFSHASVCSFLYLKRIQIASNKSAAEVAHLVSLQVRRRLPVTLKVAKMKQAKILVSMIDRPTSVKKTLSGANFKDMIAAGASTEEIAAMMQLFMRTGGGAVQPAPSSRGGGGGSGKRTAPPAPPPAARRPGRATPSSELCSSFSKPSRDEFEVDINLDESKQLGMDLKVSVQGLIQVKDFYDGSDGGMLPVEKQGEILTGDFIVSVNGQRFRSYDDCISKLAAAARAGGVLALGVLPRDSPTVGDYQKRCLFVIYILIKLHELSTHVFISKCFVLVPHHSAPKKPALPKQTASRDGSV